MTISIKEQIFSVNVDDKMFETMQPMPTDFDIRISRTPEMIQQKKDALTFVSDNLVRVEQPWLVYQEDGINYILNGVTRYLALKELWEEKTEFDFSPVPYMVLEEGWTEDELKSLQHSANNFGTKTEEIVIARESVYLYEDELEKEIDKIKTSKEKDENGKAIKGANIAKLASTRAQETVLASPIFRGKTLRHFRRYQNVIQKGTDKLQDFVAESLITLRNADELIVANNKYTKACVKAEETPRDLDFILDDILLTVQSKIDPLNQKAEEQFNKLTDKEKEETELDIKPYVIQKNDIDAWFKEHTSISKKDGNKDDEDGENLEDDGKVVSLSEANNNLQEVINFCLTYTYDRTEENSTKNLRELVDILKAQVELTSAAMDTLSTKDIEPQFDELFQTTSNLISGLPKITENTPNLNQVSSRIKKVKNKIETFCLNVQTEETNKIEEIETEEETLSEEVDNYMVEVK